MSLEFYRDKDFDDKNDKLTWRLYANSSLTNNKELKIGARSDKQKTITLENGSKLLIRNGNNSTDGLLLLKDIYNTNFSASISNSWNGQDLTAFNIGSNLAQASTEGWEKFKANGLGILNLIKSGASFLGNEVTDKFNKLIGRKIESSEEINTFRSEIAEAENKAYETSMKDSSFRTLGSYKTTSAASYMKQYEGSQIDIPINITSRIYCGTGSKSNINSVIEENYNQNQCIIDVLNRLIAYLGPYPVLTLGYPNVKGEVNTSLKSILSATNGDLDDSKMLIDVAPHNFVNRSAELDRVAESCRKPTAVNGYLTLALGDEYIIPNLLASGFTYTLSTETNEYDLPLYADVQIYLRPAFKFTSDWLIKSLDNLQQNRGGN